MSCCDDICSADLEEYQLCPHHSLDVRARGVRGGDAVGRREPRAGDREVDGRRRHLSLPPQLQRRTTG